MFLLTFLDISSSCLSFWLSFSLFQKHPGVFLFWLFLLSMVFGFCSWSWLVWFSGDFPVAVVCEKNISSFLKRFCLREFIILSLDFSCSCRNSIWSCGSEIILSVLLLGSCEWDLVLRLRDVRSSFLNKFNSVRKNSFCWFIRSYLCAFNVSMKLLSKSLKLFSMLLVFWLQTLGIELFLGMDRHVRLEIILHCKELLACNNAKDFSKLSMLPLRSLWL